jgi:hypothetical protein
MTKSSAKQGPIPSPIDNVAEEFPKFYRASLARFKTPIQKYNMIDIKHALENALRDCFVLEFGWKEGIND